ncbi:hypothetical protein GCM10010211_61210 [Streptomyces albospinus]|uniref:Uncharacterized protein n=1 Tax=Streptomyces albospinus TaxID=285515 RepID=A0ABQ2VKB4_9ACTN|nr:hypothetical protein [Streptomyces albospinus]GGU86901.1 hypothetical protein GCM10010211_61210 [Streptomyces albospinus]
MAELRPTHSRSTLRKVAMAVTAASMALSLSLGVAGTAGAGMMTQMRLSGARVSGGAYIASKVIASYRNTRAGAQEIFQVVAAAGGVDVAEGQATGTGTGGDEDVVIDLTQVGELVDGEQVEVSITNTETAGGSPAVDTEAVTLACHVDPDPATLTCA